MPSSYSTRKRSSYYYDSYHSRRRKYTTSRSRSRSRSRRKYHKYHKSKKYHRRSSSYHKKRDRNDKIKQKKADSINKRRGSEHFEWESVRYIRDYKIKEHIADGTFGRCLLAKHKDSRKYYALKVIKPVQRYIESAKEESEICYSIMNYAI